MNNPSVITLRIPPELKDRVAKMSKSQGVSTNQWLMYAITEKVTESETQALFESRRSGRSEEEIITAVDAVMKKVADRSVPDWDKLPDTD